MSPKIIDQKDILTKESVEEKIKQININLERKKKGLPKINFAEQQQQQQEQPSSSEDGQQKLNAAPKLPSSPSTQNYAYFQSKIQSELAGFQADRFGEIAKSARKEKHIIYKFEDNPTPPKLGEKKNTKANLTPIDVYYNEIPTDIHYELDRMRAEVADLSYVKTLQTATIDADGRMQPALLQKNDESVTGVSDQVFATINEQIDKRNKQISATMALWYYGIDRELIPKLENTSFAYALEAGLYRELYGVVGPSKNSGVS